MSYTYKHLSAAELPLMNGLLAMFGEAFGDRDTYQGAVPSEAYLTSLLEKPHFIALAALRDGEVVGGLAAYELQKFERARSEIYVYDLAVREADRRKGVATTLIRTLQRIAKDRGAYVIFVQADTGPGDQPAIRLYESLGAQGTRQGTKQGTKGEEVLHFDIPVD